MIIRKLHTTPQFTIYGADTATELELPLMQSRISAGFPSPADDFIEERIDLNRSIIKNPDATFYLRVDGKSMIDAGIDQGDLLVIDSSLEATNGKVVVCEINREYTVKRLRIEKGNIYLDAENKDYPTISVTGEDELKIFGVVTNVIKDL